MLENLPASLSRKKKELRSALDAVKKNLKALEVRRRERTASLPSGRHREFRESQEEINRLCEKIGENKSNDRYNRSLKDMADYVSGLVDKLQSKISKSALKPEEISFLLTHYFTAMG